MTTPHEAMAAALHRAEVDCWPGVDGCPGAKDHITPAKGILAALAASGWVLRRAGEAGEWDRAVEAFGIAAQTKHSGLHHGSPFAYCGLPECRWVTDIIRHLAALTREPRDG